MNPGKATEAAELAEAETAYRDQLAREMCQADQGAGFEVGYRQANADEAAQWARIARPVVHDIPHTELQERRWGSGGRSLRRPAARRLPRPGRQTASRTQRRTRHGGSA